MRNWRRHHAAAAVATVVLVVVGLFAAPMFIDHSHPPQFCTLAMAITTVNGQFVELQDQHAPGRQKASEPCGDLGRTDADFNVLGFDCKVRDPAGTVIARTTPNRHDGTCGQSDH